MNVLELGNPISERTIRDIIEKHTIRFVVNRTNDFCQNQNPTHGLRARAQI